MKLSAKFILVLSTLIQSALVGNTQPPHAFSWYTSKGDPSLKTVHQITQDADGFIWLATWDGLLRYDGYSFTRFSQPPESLTNRFTALAADDQGDIWAIADGNILYRYRKASDSILPVDTQGRAVSSIWPADGRSLFLTCEDRSTLLLDTTTGVVGSPPGYFPPGAPLNGVFSQKNGAIWLLSSQGAYCSDGKTLPALPITAAAESDGVLFFGSEAGTLYAREGEKIKPLHVPDPGEITTLSPIPGRRELLVCTSETGIFLLNPETGVSRQLRSPSFQTGSVQATTDPDGRVWLFSSSGGLDWMDPETGTLVPFYDRHIYRLGWNAENKITAVFCDRQGILWAGTKWNGLMKAVIYEDHFELFEVGKSLGTSPESSVRAMYEDNTGRFWIATRDGRVHLYDSSMNYLGDLFRDGTIRRGNGDTMEAVYDIAQDQEGTIWLGTRGQGLVAVRQPTGRLSAFRIDFPGRDSNQAAGAHPSQIFSLYPDQKKRLWIASFDQGLSFMDLSEPEPSYSNISTGRFRFVSGGSDKSILACGPAGLMVCEDLDSLVFHRFVISGSGHLTSVSDMQHLLTASDGRVYVCSYGAGFNRFNGVNAPNPFSAVTTQEGLLSNFTLSALEDKDGRIWITTDEGLNRYDPVTQRVESFPHERIGYEIHFNEGKPLRTRNGELFFASTRGILHFNPDRIGNNDYVPPLIILSSGADGETTHRMQQRAEIRAGQRLNVQYQAMDLTQPERILYYYKLEGRDNDWIPSGNSRSITLPHLRHGEYFLHLRSTNANGIEVDNEIVLPVTVRIRPWLSPWAWILYFTLGATTLTVMLYIRRRRFQANEPYYGGLRGADREFVKDLVNYLYEHLEDPSIDVPQMAARMNVSRSVLFERTRAILDKSPAALLREIRFEKARELIREGKYNLSQITFRTGFNDPHYFSTSFKRQYGMTPSEYKKSLEQN